VKALWKMIAGETYVLPIGVALVLLGGLVLKGASWWHHAGGFVLLAGVIVVLSVSLRRKAP
jgi:thiosulfate reductase cytochrome b subunit